MSGSKLAEWSAAVKARDQACKRCGSADDLHAHHIKPKSTHPELMLDPDNGLTLCYRCHKAEHERNRPPRIRSSRPQRRSLERQIEELHEQIRRLWAHNKELSKHVGQCKRGSCDSGLELSRARHG